MGYQPILRGLEGCARPGTIGVMEPDPFPERLTELMNQLARDLEGARRRVR